MRNLKNNRERDNTSQPEDLSKKFKIRVNRFFREEVGEAYLPHPEVDTAYERARSRIVTTIKRWSKYRKN